MNFDHFYPNDQSSHHQCGIHQYQGPPDLKDEDTITLGRGGQPFGISGTH